MKKSIAITLGCWLAAVSINYYCRIQYPLTVKEEIRFVPNKEVVDILCLDHQGLAADVLLIQAVLHSGSLMWKPLSHQFDSQWSYRLMDLATQIDPHYLTAYLFTGMGMVHGSEDVRRARPILERGIAHLPEVWELPFWIGYHNYVYLEDYRTAGNFFWRAGQYPNAPKSFLSLMLSSLKKSGRYEKAVLALQGLMQSTENERVKLIYQKRITRLENMIMLQKTASEFKNRTGYFPEDLNQLVSKKLIPAIPDDPMGQRYVWDKGRKRVMIAEQP